MLQCVFVLNRYQLIPHLCMLLIYKAYFQRLCSTLLFLSCPQEYKMCTSSVWSKTLTGFLKLLLVWFRILSYMEFPLWSSSADVKSCKVWFTVWYRNKCLFSALLQIVQSMHYCPIWEQIQLFHQMYKYSSGFFQFFFSPLSFVFWEGQSTIFCREILLAAQTAICTSFLKKLFYYYLPL